MPMLRSRDGLRMAGPEYSKDGRGIISVGGGI